MSIRLFCALPLLLFRPAPAVFVTQTNPPFVVPLIALVAALQHFKDVGVDETVAVAVGVAPVLLTVTLTVELPIGVVPL